VRALRLAVWVGGGALCAVMIATARRHDWPPATRATIAYGASFVALSIGVLVWRRRPESRTGILLTAFPLAFLVADLAVVFWTSRTAVTVGFAGHWLAAPILAHVVLSYPTGRLTSRVDRGFVALGYFFAAVYAVPLLLFYDPRRSYDLAVWDCWSCAVPLTHVGDRAVYGTLDALDTTLSVLAVVFLGLLVRKLWRAGPSERGIVLPLTAAGAFLAAQFVVQVAVYGAPVNSWRDDRWFWVVGLGPLGVPVSLAGGLLFGRAARGAVADLLVALERTPPGGVRDALAQTLGDPSLELALWLPERETYVDATGTPVEPRAFGARRAVTVLGPPEAPIAALVHDPALLERRALLEAAGAAARLALENERLHAELRAQLAELRASRARILTAGDEERRRLERDLHDGAQQRLLALGLSLQLARARLGSDANGAAELLEEAGEELRAALDELRELARGIHPAVLSEQGLGAALTTLAERSPVPVTIGTLPRGPLPAPVEAAAYFLVSEALANVAKHGQASAVRVNVVHRDALLRVDVEDDGVGGADPARGSGLRGLADRVHALDGELDVESTPGRGTRVRAELPCA
jgi:signal transduction histidine kinase